MDLEILMISHLTVHPRKPLPLLQQMILVTLETLVLHQSSSPQKPTTVLAILEILALLAIPRQLRRLRMICLARLAQGRRSLLTLPLRRAVSIFSTSPPSPPLPWADSPRISETWESIAILNPLVISSIRNPLAIFSRKLPPPIRAISSIHNLPPQIRAHPTCLIPPPLCKRKRTLRIRSFLRNPRSR